MAGGGLGGRQLRACLARGGASKPERLAPLAVTRLGISGIRLQQQGGREWRQARGRHNHMSVRARKGSGSGTPAARRPQAAVLHCSGAACMQVSVQSTLPPPPHKHTQNHRCFAGCIGWAAAAPGLLAKRLTDAAAADGCMDHPSDACTAPQPPPPQRQPAWHAITAAKAAEGTSTQERGPPRKAPRPGTHPERATHGSAREAHCSRWSDPRAARQRTQRCWRNEMQHATRINKGENPEEAGSCKLQTSSNAALPAPSRHDPLARILWPGWWSGWVGGVGAG